MKSIIHISNIGLIISFIAIMFSQSCQPQKGTMTDTRDNQIYKTIKLKDGKIWLAQNLNFNTKVGCWFYNNDYAAGLKFGRLYNWDAAKEACPRGWHLPSSEDWEKLINAYNNIDLACDALIQGCNSDGFGGLRNAQGGFYNLGIAGFFWSSSETSRMAALSYHFSKPYHHEFTKNWGVPCRCIKN